MNLPKDSLKRGTVRPKKFCSYQTINKYPSSDGLHFVLRRLFNFVLKGKYTLFHIRDGDTPLQDPHEQSNPSTVSPDCVPSHCFWQPAAFSISESSNLAI